MAACSRCSTENPDHARFCLGCGTRLSAATEARRRLITALFCDLVGSTEIAERVDAEVVRKVLDRYFDAMRSAIDRHGGTVEKFIGDAVVGAFGVPTAHEDDTLRAVRAAFDMRRAAAEIDDATDDPEIQVSVRIAIDCGEAMADVNAAEQGRIGGGVFNTAARLQALAEPGDVLVSGSAEQMLRGRVDLAALGPMELKGKAEPVLAYRVLNVLSTPERIETPIVGRERPLRMLTEAFDDSIDAHACVQVTVLAPPGVGKSRLATAFADAVGSRATILVGQTPSYGDGVTFAPLVELLAQAAGTPSGDAEAVANALRANLAAQADGASVGERLAQVLGVGEAAAADTSWAVRRLLEVLASETPVVVVLEDLHWAEQPMLDLVDSVVERLHGPVLVLCLARPELLEQRPTWAAGKPRTITTTLPPLSAEAAREFAELLLGSHVPATVVDRVCRTAEGNPLYLEQLRAMLVDQGLLADGRWTGPDDAVFEIPGTLQALLAARLDHLDPASRQILERAAVEGRTFRAACLGALLTETPADEVDAALATLDRRGLVEPEDEALGRWRFTHALVREAAYRGLSKELRGELHERLADWMIVQDADLPDVDESVARHLERACHFREELGLRDARTSELAERAGELFAAAGTRAFAALDIITTRELLGRAATLLPELSPRRLDLLPNLGVALTETGRPAETEALLTKAVQQARAVGSERDALRAKIQLLSNHVYRAPSEDDIAAAVGEARAAADALNALGDEVGLAEASIALEYLEWMRGRVAEMHAWASRAMQHALATGRPREATQASSDFVLSAVFGPLPFPRVAATADRLLSSDDPIAASTSHVLLALAAFGAGDRSTFRSHERRWQEVIDRHGLAWLGATHAIAIALAEISGGDTEAAEQRLREAKDTVAAFGDIWFISTIDPLLCTALGAQDRTREFLRLADALETSVLVPDRDALTRRHLVRSRAHLLRGSAADAEVEARHALEVVETTDLLLTHAEALILLAAVLDERGGEDEAQTRRKEAEALYHSKANLAALANLSP